jgi:peptide/nickel transport system permease protein
MSITVTPARGSTGGTAASKHWKRWKKEPAALLSLIYLVGLCLIAVFKDLLAPHDPNAQDLTAAYLAPSRTHLLGTDQFGRDVLSRLIDATQVTVTAPLVAVGVALAVGLTTGLLAGYRGGWIDWMLFGCCAGLRILC